MLKTVPGARFERALSPLWTACLLPIGLPGQNHFLRAPGAIRTRTVDVLNVVPLPLGHEGVTELEIKKAARSRQGGRRGSRYR
jgi:hypothetical protein